MKKTFILMCTVMFLGGTINTAKALILSDVSGSWSNIVGGTNITDELNQPIGYGNGSEDRIRWGVGSEGQSGLGFTGRTPNGTVEFEISEPFEIGQLRHFNNPIESDSAASSADLTINTQITDTESHDGSFSFTFNITETPNAPGPPDSDDIIGFPSSFASEVFVINGIEYTMELLGFGNSPDNLMISFISLEGTTNATRLWGQITTPGPVPEPTSMLLLGSGLIGMFGYKRKKSPKS